MNSISTMVMPWPRESLQAYLELLQVNYLRFEERDTLGVCVDKTEEEYSLIASRLLEYLFKANHSVIVLRDGVKYLYTFQEFFVMIPSSSADGICWWPTHFESLDDFLNWAVEAFPMDESEAGPSNVKND